jgi:predicted thioesterase
VKAGLSAVVSLVVGEDDTAIAMHSGTVPVLATPRVVALVEEAAVCAIADALEPGQTTVGMQVLLDHVQPSAIGRTVDAEATVKECNGRRIVFTVSVKDERGLVAAGKVTRVAVDIDRFLDKA